MTIRHLKIFSTVCSHDCRITRAAEALHLTQPAVSLAIKELEQYYDVILFDRIGRHLQLTKAGECLLLYAAQICSQFDEMEDQMRNWNQNEILRIGASITIGSQLMPSYVRRFQQTHPGCRIYVTVNSSDLLETKILNGELDFALIEGLSHSPFLISNDYMEDRLIVAAAADSGFSENQILSAEEFRSQNFLLREPGSGTREVFDRAVETAGFTVSPIWECMSTAALVNAVIGGLGISVLPERMVRGPLEQKKIIPLQVEGLDFCRKFRIIHHKGKFLTDAAQSFIEMCRQHPE